MQNHLAIATSHQLHRYDVGEPRNAHLNTNQRLKKLIFRKYLCEFCIEKYTNGISSSTIIQQVQRAINRIATMLESRDTVSLAPIIPPIIRKNDTID